MFIFVNGGGLVVNIVLIFGSVGFVGLFVYVMVKYGVVGMIKLVVFEYFV